MSTYNAHPEYPLISGYCPQVIFIDSMSLGMSSLDRSGIRCSEAKAISVPLKALSLWRSLQDNDCQEKSGKFQPKPKEGKY